MARPVSRTRFDELVEAEFVAQPLAPPRTLTEDDLISLPIPVQRYVRASGAVGTQGEFALRSIACDLPEPRRA